MQNVDISLISMQDSFPLQDIDQMVFNSLTMSHEESHEESRISQEGTVYQFCKPTGVVVCQNKQSLLPPTGTFTSRNRLFMQAT